MFSWPPSPGALGAVLAIIVVILAILMAVGTFPLNVTTAALLFGLLGLSRLT